MKNQEEIIHHSVISKTLCPTVNCVFQEWLDLEAIFKYQENTIIDYKKRYYKHIQPQLGNTAIQSVDYKLLQRFFNEKKDIGYVTNYKLKEILNVILNFSIKCNYIQNNPISYIYISGIRTPRNENIVALYIGKYTGMRISEVFALQKDDIDFERKQISISKKLVYAEKKRHEIY